MRSRTRLIAIVASLLVCIAMVGTGFASWVILQNQSIDSAGNVTAEAVTDSRVKLSVQPTENADIKFGAPKSVATPSDNSSSYWLVADKSTGEEKLSVAFTITLGGNIASLKIAFAKPTGSSGTTAYDTAVTGKLIAANPTWSVTKFDAKSNGKATSGSLDSSKIKVVVDEAAPKWKVTFDDKDGFDFGDGPAVEITLTATFSWGEIFKTEDHDGSTAEKAINPYYFFNGDGRTVSGASASSDKTDLTKFLGDDGLGSAKATIFSGGDPTTWGDAAKGVLGWMNTNFENLSYKFTFSATGATSTAAG